MPFVFRLFCLAIIWCSLLASASNCHAEFTTVLNIPAPDANIGDGVSIDSDTQLNLSEGGAIGSSFDAGASNGTSSTNVEVNIFGGTVGSGYRANNGSTTNISGGVIGNVFFANTGSTVNITGGNR